MSPLEAKAVRLAALLRKHRLAVPWYQRFYDWSVDDVKHLLDDIDDAMQEKRKLYFLGVIMLVDSGDGCLRGINDGQQRIVTFSLICACLCRHFKESGKRDREKQALRLLFAISEDHEYTLADARGLPFRLSPPEKDRSTYEHLVRCQEFGNGKKISLAWKAIDLFFENKEREEPNYRENFFAFFVKAVNVVAVDVQDSRDLNPHAIFETLNARGKELDEIDLIKNHIFSFFRGEDEKERLKTVKNWHEQTYSHFDDNAKLQEYVRRYSQMRFGPISDKKFYQDFKKKVLIEAQDASCNIADLLYEFSQDIRSRVSLYQNVLEIRDLKPYAVAHPIVLALYYRLCLLEGSEKEVYAEFVKKARRVLTVFVLRAAHTQGSFRPTVFDKEFPRLAHAVYNGSCTMAEDFFNRLRNCDKYNLILDANYISALENVRFGKPNTKARQLLISIANHHFRDEVLVNEDNCTLEHILPESPAYANGWGFNKESHSYCFNQLGNFTLLKNSDNRPEKSHNRNFASKQAIFKGSSLKINQRLGRQRNWNPNKIRDRSKELAELAAEVWKFDI